jgi:hypothetical protein
MRLNKYFFLVSSLLTVQLSYSQSITGKVSSRKKEPIPFVNLFCPSINTGSSTNLDGEFVLKLRNGKNRVIISCVGYLNDTIDVDLQREEIKRFEIELEEKATLMQTIYVFDSNLSEAERIILRAISSKEDYLKRIQNYEYNAYDKSVLSIKRKDSLSIVGVFETQLKGYYQYPDNFNEVILSKRHNKIYPSMMNNVLTMGSVPNVLKENIKIDELAVVSPLNTHALDYYSFGIKDTIYWNYKRIFLLEFIPKNKSLPLFSGKIGIIDSIYVPVMLNLIGGKNILTSRGKDIEIEEKFIELNDCLWFPNSIFQKYTFNIDFPGYPDIYCNHTWLLSDFKINSPNFFYHFTNNAQSEKLVSELESEKLWNLNQQILLTKEEKLAVHRIDSLTQKLSLFGRIIIGLTKFSIEGGKLPFTSFNDFYHFNRVEGHYAGVGVKLDSILNNTKLTLKLGYGFSDKKIKYSSLIMQQSNPLRLYIKIYDDINYINQFYDYSPIDITYQSWFGKNDYADYYYSKGIAAGIDFKLDENFTVGTLFTKCLDSDAQLNSDWSLLNKDGRYRPIFIIDEGDLTNYSVVFKFDNRKYLDLGFLRFPDYSYDFLNAELKIMRGFYDGIFKNDSYWQLYLNIFGSHNSAGIFNPRYNLLAGTVAGADLIQNRFHLPGLFAYASSTNSFSSIRSDIYSGSEFFCLFFENNFRNILFKAIGFPFLKESKYDFIIFGKYGWINNSEPTSEPNRICETGFSLSNIFTFFRFDFTWHIKPDGKDNFYFTLGSLIPF